ncbi:hypothetical protein PHYC_03390 [Phycisphaerales bacterium]|nr:hypothetical protein PHYC_03390 [Phycisphaerales bacterium]
MTTLRRRLRLAAASACVVAWQAHGAVWFVRWDATGANDGASWTDAFTTLHSAMAAAGAGDEVWVAAGDYPAGAGLTLPSGVRVFGGFRGDEASRGQRDWNANVSSLVGNWPSGRGPVVIVTNAAAGTSLDGLTIRAGNAIQASGGGVLATGGSLAVRNCTFASNYVNWGYGGGLYANNVALDIEDCRFTGNYAHLACGGAMALVGGTEARISDCVFSGNTAVTAGSGGEGLGAGIQNESTLPVTVTRCAFDFNVARGLYACQNGPQWAWGGAIDSFADGLTVRDCVFSNNQAHYGGAIFAWGDTMIVNSVFHHNTATTICTSAGTAGGEAGAIGGMVFTPGTLTILNSTIANNSAREGAGINTYYSLEVLLRNSIVWGNVATGEDVEPLKRQMRGTIAARYSCVQDLFTPVPGEDPPDPANFPGCIDADPLPMNAAAGNFRLQAASVCIDAGSNADLPPGVVEDADGHDRAVRGLPGPGDGVTDMGAFEFGAAACAPTITLHPQGASACVGGEVVLGSGATGVGTLAYQWLREGAPVVGAVAPTLVIGPASLADEGSYRCVVSNACGDSLTMPAIVLVSECGPSCDPDVNCDGSVNGFDIEAMEQAVNGDLSNFCQPDADYNHDGSVNGFDIEAVEQSVNGGPCP